MLVSLSRSHHERTQDPLVWSKDIAAARSRGRCGGLFHESFALFGTPQWLPSIRVDVYDLGD